MNDNLSILGANTLELHYWVDDNSHQINAYVQNKCEKELLDILSEIAHNLAINISIETMPLANGGVRRWFKIVSKTENKKALITIAIITALATGILVTPITSTLDAIIQNVIQELFEDKEFMELQKENLKLDIELKRIALLKRQNIQNKIEKKRSNFYNELNQGKNISQISITVQNNNHKTIIPEAFVPKQNFQSYIIKSNDLTPEIIEGAIIEIISPVLKKGTYKWRGIYNGESLSFNMKSNEFKTLVQTGSIEFTNGSSIKCLLRVNKSIDSNGDEKITEYDILRVDEYFKNTQPVETPEGRKYRQSKEAEKMQGKLFDD